MAPKLSVSCEVPPTPGGSLTTFDAFTPTPSGARASTSVWMPQCPMGGNKCAYDGKSSLPRHLCKVHKAAHYSVAFDENKTANVQLDTTVWLKEALLRRTAVVLTLSDNSVHCWSVETRKRADGEIQVSAVVQLLQPPSSKPREVMGGTDSTSTIGADDFPVTGGRDRASSDSSFAAGTIAEDEEQEDISYNASLSVKVDGREPLVWEGVLNSNTFSRPHDRLVSHGDGLVALYPTQAFAFRQVTATNSSGVKESALELPVQLKVERIWRPSGW